MEGSRFGGLKIFASLSQKYPKVRSMHYYQFNIADYRKDTTHLSMLEHGAYRQLLDWHYLEQAPIPLETDKVFRRLCAKTEEERLAVVTVLEELFKRTSEGYIQGRAMSEIAQYEAKAECARQAGKLGGRPKKTKAVIYGLENITELKANSRTQELINSKLKTTVWNSSARFDEFWSVWPKTPRKVAKLSCEKKWHEKKLDSIADQIIQHVSEIKKTKQWINGFEPGPLTYLKQGRWADEIFTAIGTSPSNTKPWYITNTGIDAKGKELGIQYEKDEQFPSYKVRVYKEAGITPELVRAAFNDFERKTA